MQQGAQQGKQQPLSSSTLQDKGRGGAGQQQQIALPKTEVQQQQQQQQELEVADQVDAAALDDSR
jgi:hypothetical protein